MTDFCAINCDLVPAFLLGCIHNCKYYTMSEATPMLRLHHELKLMLIMSRD